MKCGVQFKQDDISGTMTPSLEIGYQFTTGIFKKIETLLDQETIRWSLAAGFVA